MQLSLRSFLQNEPMVLVLMEVSSCLKGVVSGDWTEEKFQSNLLVSLARKLFFELVLYVRIGPILNSMNWTLIGLNWTVLLKCFEMTFVVIWCYINKLIELNLVF